mmetsp:Transcript_27082/g.43380  ORF Transcript_27082/g.43380 Transcript_27082/m.43380 type:complete len:209 (+) Transcript_27082:268-894(+)
MMTIEASAVCRNITKRPIVSVSCNWMEGEHLINTFWLDIEDAREFLSKYYSSGGVSVAILLGYCQRSDFHRSLPPMASTAMQDGTVGPSTSPFHLKLQIESSVAFGEELCNRNSTILCELTGLCLVGWRCSCRQTAFLFVTPSCACLLLGYKLKLHGLCITQLVRKLAVKVFGESLAVTRLIQRHESPIKKPNGVCKTSNRAKTVISF